MAPPIKSQVELAQRMYDNRAHDYDKSWHFDYSKRFIEMADIREGDHILDLACGTGLEAVLAAPIVGDDGLVVGVDVTDEMLDVFRIKLQSSPPLARRVKLIRHDATDLPTCPEIQKGDFDKILCSNAFVLFDNPVKVLGQWREYLKPNGRMVIDVPHPHSFRHGVIMEIVAEHLGIQFPSKRLWIKSPESFKRVLEEQGLIVEQVEELDHVSGRGCSYFDLSEADAQFESIIAMPLSTSMATDEFKAKAKPLFREEWDKAAMSGKIENRDSIYIYIARRP
ncbi:S-adenosyl-L-methionine-dependent methyltransferase [Trichoderma sp. SZMC 28014]